MTDTKQPNAEQVAAVLRFRDEFHRLDSKSSWRIVNWLNLKAGPVGNWKETLVFAWFNDRDYNAIPDGHLLRQVRNQFGPAWLDTFNSDEGEAS